MLRFLTTHRVIRVVFIMTMFVGIVSLRAADLQGHQVGFQSTGGF